MIEKDSVELTRQPIGGGASIDRLTVATDGACQPTNPGPTGWAWVDEHGAWAAGAVRRGTNQVGELLGLLGAITAHGDVVHLTIEADSAYAIGTYTKWMDAHAARGWITSAGKPTSNRTIIEQLVVARDARRAAGLPDAQVVKVKGHSGHALNSWADNRAVRAARHAREGKEQVWTGDGLDVNRAAPVEEQDAVPRRGHGKGARR